MSTPAEERELELHSARVYLSEAMRKRGLNVPPLADGEG